MMLENIKSAVLTILVLSSVTLTWLLWTYQPEYGVREESGENYVEIEDLGETRDFHEIIQPKEILIHEGEEIAYLHPMEGQYRTIINELKEIDIDYLYRRGPSHAPSLEHFYNGLELVFDDPLESEWLKDLFNFEEDHLPLEQADRIVLVENPPSSSGTEVMVQFVDIEEEVIYESETSFSVSQLQALYEGTEEHQTPVEKRVFQERPDSDFQPVKYTPTESTTLRKYTYETTDLSTQSFFQILFPDPEFIQNYSQGSQGQTYTDGNRMINLQENGAILNYVRPNVRATIPAGMDTILQDSLDFINTHSGWTDDFYAEDWREMEVDDRASFRLHVGGFPVYGSNMNREHHYMMDVRRTGNTITEYTRPMYQLNEHPFETTSDVNLPSFEEVERHIEENEVFSMRAVEDIRIAHYMTRQRSFAIFEPAWFLKVEGRWIQLDFSSNSGQEVTYNGLE